MKSAGFGGKPDFLIGRVAVDDDLRAILEFDFQHRAVEAAPDVAVVEGVFDTREEGVGQLVEFAFSH